ncbi:MAG: patatin-like phospholipase family protein [Actinomycetota bacterium]|nr:patatin-like phospholipase family protein [Actinomycetota bacterium]
MADTPDKQADLVLEGGGVKGIGLVGALSVLEEEGYTFRRVAGTSAGSIVDAGISMSEVKRIMDSLDYTKFRDRTMLDRIPLIGRWLSSWFKQGVYKGDYLHEFVADQLAKHEVVTYGDLRLDDPESHLPVDQRYKLIVNVADVSRSHLLRLPWDYRKPFGLDPDQQSVADSVRSSASIPFFFRPMKLKPASGKKSWLVDGGMLSNYPITTFDRDDGQPDRWPTIGVKLSSERRPNVVRHDVHSTVSLGEAMIGTLTGWYDLMHIEDPDIIARTIFVDTTGFSSTDFGISDDD